MDKSYQWIVVFIKKEKKQTKTLIESLKTHGIVLQKEKNYVFFLIKRTHPLIQTLLDFKEFYPKQIFFISGVT